MKKHLYEIKRLEIPAYLKWWFIKYRNAGTLSEVLENLTSPITLTNSLKRRFKIFEIGGKSEQETFTGKNLLEVLTNVYKDRGLTTTKLSDGGFKVTGTAMSTYSFIIYNEPINLESGTYTFSIKERLTTNLRLFPMLEDGTTEGSMTISAGSKSTTTTFTNKIIGIRILLFTTEGTNYDLTIYPMIEQGSTATAYEPYTGGQPAPNPGYECPITNVTGDVEVKVENEENIIPTKIDEWEQGTISASNGNLQDSTTRIRTKKFIELKSHKYYGKIQNQDYCFLNVMFYNENETYLGSYDANVSVINGESEIVLNFPTNVYKIKVLIRNKNNTTDITPSEILAIKPLIVEDYDNYEEQTAIFPLEEGQVLHEGDTIEDKIVQKRKTVAFDGTEDWTANGSYNNQYYRYIPTLNDRKKNGTGLSNYFSVINNIDSVGLYNGIGVNFIIEGIETVADWKAWLAEKYANGTPVTLEYELATPIETEFTEAQRTAKAQIDSLHSYKGTTYISSTNDPSPLFTIQYVKEET